MTPAVGRVSNGGSAYGGGAGDACRGPHRAKNKPRNLRNLRSVAWTAALGLLSRVPASSGEIFAYNNMDLEVRRLAMEAREIRELISLPDPHLGPALSLCAKHVKHHGMLWRLCASHHMVFVATNTQRFVPRGIQPTACNEEKLIHAPSWQDPSRFPSLPFAAVR